MKLSIITVVRNNVSQIGETLDSVLSQNYPSLEYIVIDGASTDGTTSEIEKRRSGLACFLSEPDRGIYDAMNKGIARASGDVINGKTGFLCIAANDAQNRNGRNLIPTKASGDKF